MSHGLSKSRLQAFRQCPKRLWLTAYRPDLQDVSEQTEQRFQIGFQVGDIARSLYPDGVLIDTPDAAEALALTRKALAKQPDRPLFEAAFQRDGVLVRADLLLPEADGYRLREVKAWREWHHPDTSTERRAELRAALAEYCPTGYTGLGLFGGVFGRPTLMVARSGEMAPETNEAPNDESAETRPATEDSE